MHRYVYLAIIVCLAPSCVPVSSTSLETGDIKAHFTVTAYGSGGCGGARNAKVEGDFRTEKPAITSTVRMTGADKLTVAYGKFHSGFKESSSFGVETVEASIAVDTPEGLFVVIGLDRGPGGKAAPRSFVKLPTPFELNFKHPKGDLSRTKDEIIIPVEGDSASGEQMKWAAEGECIESTEAEVSPALKSIIISKRRLKTRESGKSTSCDVDITVSRFISGVTDPAFADKSTITALQSRTVTIDSVP